MENLFVHFPTAESAFRYSEHGKLLGTVEGSDSCMAIYQNSAGAFCTFVFPRTEQGYQLPTAGRLKTGLLERSDLGDFNVVQYSGSSDQYVDGFLYDENTDPEEVVGRSLDSVIMIPSGVGIASFYALLSPSEKGALQNGDFAARLSQQKRNANSREIVENHPQFSRLLHSKASPGIQTSAKCGKCSYVSATQPQFQTNVFAIALYPVSSRVFSG